MGRALRTVQALTFARPSFGPAFSTPPELAMPGSGSPAWRSNGGPTRNHPARSWPNSFEAPLPKVGGLVRIHILGVLAQFAGPTLEVPGTLGASIQLLNGEVIAFRKELVNSRHYGDAQDLTQVERSLGSEGMLRTVGTVAMDEAVWRVDLLTLELERPVMADSLKWKSLSSPASFAIFDVFVETTGGHPCPFHSDGGGVPLNRIAPIVRLGDRVEFGQAMEQLKAAVLATSDLDDARGEALTFLAAVTAAMLEAGGSRNLVREQLLAARELESSTTPAEIYDAIRARIQGLASTLFRQGPSVGDDAVDRALAYLDRNYAKPLTDASVARELGLSASHFRFLFRQVTGQPFHKYLVALRLERAKEMIISEQMTVGDVAEAVGFGALSHFSRSFTQRFGVNPTNVKKVGR
jgi:AraC-like DNA-binding protein